MTSAPALRRVFLLGATGSIGRATARALIANGHVVTALIRAGADAAGLDGVTLRRGEATDAALLARDGFAGEAFDAVVSCLASRNGAPADAWAVDHAAHVAALDLAEKAGVRRFVQISAICVQKPRLAFQHAKLAFEAKLMASRVPWTIIRPTAYFKSLSGQLARLRAGKPFLMFGDGRLTSTKPISDDDLARYIAARLEDGDAAGRILPIGGPGPAITPRDQGEMFFAALGLRPRFSSVPPAMLAGAARALDLAGLIAPAMKAKAEFARIGHYYATESMLVWDESRGRYDADATPETGSETLSGFFERLARGEAAVDLGAHRAF
ncbi:MAG: NAD(P)H-binding protein [Parvularculaceae bacterium]